MQIFNISASLYTNVAEQAGLGIHWSQTQKADYLASVPRFYKNEEDSRKGS